MNRREFMGAVGAAASLTTLAQSQTKRAIFPADMVQAQTKQFRKGICHVIFPADMPVEEQMKRARDAGFEGIELSMRERAPMITPETTPADAERLAAQARSIGIEITDIMTSILNTAPFTSPDPAIRDKGVGFIRKALELAPILGAGALLVVPGRLGSGPRFEVGYEEAWKRSSDCIRQLVPFAEKQKVFLCAENIWSKFLVSPLDMRAFVDQFKSPWVGTYFDVGNIMQWGYPQDWILTLGPRIKRVHIKDYKLSQKSEQGRFVPLLEGDVDWKGVMAAFRQVNYSGWLSPEYGASNEPDHLRSVSEALSKIISM